MNFSKLLNNFKPVRQSIRNNVTHLGLFFTWVVPAVFIPMGRYLEDKITSPAKKKELFVRDLTTYSVGTALYFAGRGIVNAFANKKGLHSKEKEFLGNAVGAAAYTAYAAIGSVKFTKFLGMDKSSKDNKPIVACYGLKSDSFGVRSKVNFNTNSGLSINRENVNKLENGSNNDAKNSLLFRSNTFRQFQTGHTRVNLF